MCDKIEYGDKIIETVGELRKVMPVIVGDGVNDDLLDNPDSCLCPVEIIQTGLSNGFDMHRIHDTWVAYPMPILTLPTPTPQPAEAVLLAEFEAADVLWTEGERNDTYHETESVYDAWERLMRDRDAMPILELNGDGFILSKYRDGYYVRTGINCPDQIRVAKRQS